MKEILASILLFLSAGVCTAQQAAADENQGIKLSIDASDILMKVSKDYFRSQPFSQKFSSFIGSLKNDAWFTIDQMSLRTDTTFFYLSGTYKNFNPFNYPATQVKLIIAEREFEHSDSLHSVDTIINLQLLGILDHQGKNSDAVQKEFKRFDKKYGKGFSDVNYSFSPQKGEIKTEINNYFLPLLTISPLTIAWGKVQDNDGYAFVISLRFKVVGNEASFVLSPGGL